MIALTLFLALHPLEHEGIDHLYNLEFRAAITTFETLARQEPSSPAGPHYLATALWMEELTRRGAMAGETFQSSRYWTRARKEPSPAGVEARFEAEVAEAVRRAERLLAANPKDLDALYFLGATEAVVSAFEATVRHGYFRAYLAGRRARKSHERLIEVDPAYADAYLVPGAWEYTIASLPRSVKVLVFLVGIRGSKEEGIELVRKAARDGQRARWGARLLLVVMDAREKRYGQALGYVRELETAFPRNPLFPVEKGWVHLLAKDWRAARDVFEAIRTRQRLHVPNFDAVHPSLVLLRLGESLLFDGRFQEAVDTFSSALTSPGAPDIIRTLLHLRRGQAYDGLKRRQDACAEYETVIRTSVDKTTRQQAKLHLERPFRLGGGN